MRHNSVGSAGQLKKGRRRVELQQRSNNGVWVENCKVQSMLLHLVVANLPSTHMLLKW